MEARIMTRAATIAEWPVPPKRRLAFPRLILRMIGNPIAGWSEDFYCVAASPQRGAEARRHDARLNARPD
jgi:hypothetical protein